MPETGSLLEDEEELEYHQHLRLLLGLGNFHHAARFVCEPGYSEPEWSVTLYDDPEGDCSLECRVAERNIWDMMQRGNELRRVKVRSREVAFNRDLARRITAVWARLLDGVRYLPSNDKMIMLDGVTCHLSMNMLGDRMESGNFWIGSEDPDVDETETVLRDVMTLAVSLKSYAQAADEARKTVARKQVTEAIAKLESKVIIGKPKQTRQPRRRDGTPAKMSERRGESRRSAVGQLRNNNK